MHPDSMQLMTEVLDKISLENAKVLDVGSLDVNGTYRPLVESRGWEYVGLDLHSGRNVDVVALYPYKYPFEDGAFDVVISGSTMEHVQKLWLWILELYRILERGGWLALCTVMAWGEHRHPVDCWRVMPDGMKFLLTWAGFRSCQVYTADQTILGLAQK